MLSKPREFWSRALLCAPFFVLLFVFWAIPFWQGVELSLQSNTLYGDSEFVGLRHYVDLLNDERYWKAARNTVVFAVSACVLVVGIALLLAHGVVACRKSARGISLFVFMIPGLCPPTVMAFLFLLLFHGSEGLLNRWIVMPFGLEPINWLSDPDAILSAIVLQSVWRWTGFMAFFLISALESIPTEILEAARLEGAKAWARFSRITVPLLFPTIMFCLIYMLVDCFAQFAGAYILLGGSGGTGDSGLLMVSYAYQRAFIGGDFGSGAAIGLSMAPWLLGVVGLFAFLPRKIWSR